MCWFAVSLQEIAMMLLATLLYNMFDYCNVEQPFENGPWLSHSETHSALSHSETHSDNESMSGLENFGTHITVAHALDMQTAHVQP